MKGTRIKAMGDLVVAPMVQPAKLSENHAPRGDSDKSNSPKSCPEATSAEIENASLHREQRATSVSTFNWFDGIGVEQDGQVIFMR